MVATANCAVSWSVPTDTHPVSAAVLVGANQFLLLGVHADHRVRSVHVRLGLVVEVLELRVAVRVLTTLGGLGVGLQAVAQLPQQPPDHEVADPVTVLGQRPRQGPSRLARPPQRRHRVPLVTGSINTSNAATRSWSWTSARFRPPPGRRDLTTEAASRPWASARPRRTVSGATPAASGTPATPPAPSSAASAPNHNRR